MCGFLVWIALTVGAWYAYFNAKSDPANNPGGATVWLVVAIVVTALFIVPLVLAIGLRSKERRELRAFDAEMDRRLNAEAARRSSRTVLIEHRRQVAGERWATFALVQYPDGSKEWVVDYDVPLLPTSVEQESEYRIVKELNDEWRRSH